MVVPHNFQGSVPWIPVEMKEFYLWFYPLQIFFIVQRPTEKSIKFLLIFPPQPPVRAQNRLFFLSFLPFLLSKAVFP